MTLEDKQARFNQLKRIVYPSDQEIEELEKLEEELKLSEQGAKPETFHETDINLGEGKGFLIPKKKYKGIISGRIEKWRDERREQNNQQPASIEEIKQLQLELRRAELQRDINIVQTERKPNKKNYWQLFRSIIGTENSPINKQPTRKKSKDSDVKISKGLDKISGKGEDKDYSTLF